MTEQELKTITSHYPKLSDERVRLLEMDSEEVLEILLRVAEGKVSGPLIPGTTRTNPYTGVTCELPLYGLIIHDQIKWLEQSITAGGYQTTMGVIPMSDEEIWALVPKFEAYKIAFYAVLMEEYYLLID